MPRYNWNIIESGVKQHKPNLVTIMSDSTKLIPGVCINPRLSRTASSAQTLTV